MTLSNSLVASEEDRFFLSYGFHGSDEWEPDRESIDVLQLIFHLRRALPEVCPTTLIFFRLEHSGDTLHYDGNIATVYAMKL
jgi:hypothetical protein